MAFPAPPTPSSSAHGIADGLSANLPLNETLRILEVAREIREKRETVDQAFQIDDVKALIREKLLKATEITGGEVTAAEVDLAIQQYYSNLNRFEEPRGFEAKCARIYVRRWDFFKGFLAASVFGLGLWYFLLGGPLSARGRQARRADELVAQIREQALTLRIPEEKRGETAPKLQKITGSLEAARTKRDLGQLQQLSIELDSLDKSLRTYESRVQQGETLANRVNEFTTLDSRHRIYAELLRLSKPAAAAKQAVISPPPTHSEIAARVSIRREAVAREIKSLERSGLIERRRGALVLTDTDKLQRLIDEAAEAD